MKYIYAFVLTLLVSCSPYWSDNVGAPPLEQKIDGEAITFAVVRYAARMKHDFGLSFEDGKCYYSECSEKVRLVFSSQKIIEIPQARELISDVVEGLLTTLNNDPIIRADQCQQQFTANDVEIYINFESWFVQYIDPFYLTWIELNDGVVCYYMGTLKEYYYDTWHQRIEPYFKTLQIARAQREAANLYPTEPITGIDTDGSIIEAGVRNK